MTWQHLLIDDDIEIVVVPREELTPDDVEFVDFLTDWLARKQKETDA